MVSIEAQDSIPLSRPLRDRGIGVLAFLSCNAAYGTGRRTQLW
jgi:hypothetical protein